MMVIVDHYFCNGLRRYRRVKASLNGVAKKKKKKINKIRYGFEC